MDQLYQRSNAIFTNIIDPQQRIATKLNGQLYVTSDICVSSMNNTEIESLFVPQSQEQTRNLSAS